MIIMVPCSRKSYEMREGKGENLFHHIHVRNQLEIHTFEGRKEPLRSPAPSPYLTQPAARPQAKPCSKLRTTESLDLKLATARKATGPLGTLSQGLLTLPGSGGAFPLRSELAKTPPGLSIATDPARAQGQERPIPPGGPGSSPATVSTRSS